MLIGLSGYAQSGKDATAKILVDNFGFVRYAFADKLKELATRLHYWSGIKDELGRLHLQYLGDQIRQVLGEDVWINALFNDADQTKDIVISDVRYTNEIHAIHNRGGLILRINRPGVDRINDHISENLPPHSSLYDGYITNNGTLYDLETDVKKWIRQMLA